MGNNIILCVMDTARADDVHFVTQHENRTFFSFLEENGQKYTNAFAPAPWTLPSHGSLFTGRYPSKHGAHAEHKYLGDSYKTIAEILQESGYSTVGVTNNAWITDEFGFDQGFDEFIKVWQYLKTNTDFGEIALTKNGIDQIKGALNGLINGEIHKNIVNALYGQYLYRRNDYGADRTNALIRNYLENRDNTNPFFMFINYLEPHLDYQPPQKYAEKYLPDTISYEDAMAVPQRPWEYVTGNLEMTERDFEALRGLYRGEISYLDSKLLELKQNLQEENEWEKTIFILVGDHGENIGHHNLMDHQYSLYDSLLHVPLMICGGPFQKGKTIEDLVQIHDIYNTIVDLVGKEVKSEQSISLHPDNDERRDQIVAEYMGPQPSIESLEEQMDHVPERVYAYDRRLRALRTQNYKIIRGSDGLSELYDIRTDPKEQTDIYEEKKDIYEEYAVTLDNWLASFEQNQESGDVDISGGTQQRLEDLGYL
ncbi:sulfatase [Halalkalicoccus ordinarius]|uniref:sulfatase n=1 Tax=Halalkalicoccus ordinarius TaxID=3116651 RepID=UPI00300EE12E